MNPDLTVNEIRRYWIRGSCAVVHCGAHLVEEAKDYAENSFSPVVWIEADPSLEKDITDRLKNFENQHLILASLWSESGIQKNFNISSNGYSSSLLEFGEHSNTFPDVVWVNQKKLTTTKLDDLQFEFFMKTLLVLDLQGAEFEALRGASNFLKRCNYVYVEVSKVQLYKDSRNWSEISALLGKSGFSLIDWEYSDNWNYGNALYGRRKYWFLNKIQRKRRKNGRKAGK